MELQFKADTHTYSSINNPEKVWHSVTKVIGAFKPPFDADAIAKKCSTNKKSKWYKMDPEKIKAIWKGESNRALRLGTWYHDQREEELVSHDTLRREGVDLPIVRPVMNGNIKLSPDQTLVPGIYPEHLIYLKSAGICGQADRVEVVGDKIDIYDYKTNKEIKTKGFTNWQGVTTMMKPPLNHLEDCNLNHYALQLSLYMYMMLKHNHSLKPGKLQIQHVVFEVEEQDEHGYPKVAYDSVGDPIVKEVVNYDVPYLRDEVQAMLRYKKTNLKDFK